MQSLSESKVVGEQSLMAKRSKNNVGNGLLISSKSLGGEEEE
jgi:hypothetical protein